MITPYDDLDDSSMLEDYMGLYFDHDTRRWYSYEKAIAIFNKDGNYDGAKEEVDYRIEHGELITIGQFYQVYRPSDCNPEDYDIID